MCEADEWEPRQASLRDEEEPDTSAHTRRTIEQLREIEHADRVGPDRQASAAERRRELEAKLEGDDGE